MRISDWSSDVCSSDLPFEGGSAEGHHLELGSESFIPGFEGQLVGAAAGESRDVTVSFPDDYQASHLAGKEAVFDVKVKEIRAPKQVAIDAAFPQSFGLDDLAAMQIGRAHVWTPVHNAQ